MYQFVIICLTIVYNYGTKLIDIAFGYLYNLKNLIDYSNGNNCYENFYDPLIFAL